MPKLKPNTILPTDEEEAMINAGIAEDIDTYELSDAEFLQLKPYYQQLNMTEQVMLNLSSEVLTAFRSTGNNWQMLMNNALKQWLQEHPL